MSDQNRLNFEGAPREPEPPELHARSGDPATSHEAMARFDREKMASAASVAARLHRVHGPMADFEFAPRFAEAWNRPSSHHLYQQARSSARDQGLIRISREEPRINPKSGRRQTVWEACDQEPPTLTKCPTCGHVTRAKAVVDKNEPPDQ